MTKPTIEQKVKEILDKGVYDFEITKDGNYIYVTTEHCAECTEATDGEMFESTNEAQLFAAEEMAKGVSPKKGNSKCTSCSEANSDPLEQFHRLCSCGGTIMPKYYEAPHLAELCNKCSYFA